MDVCFVFCAQPFEPDAARIVKTKTKNFLPGTARLLHRDRDDDATTAVPNLFSRFQPDAKHDKNLESIFFRSLLRLILVHSLCTEPTETDLVFVWMCAPPSEG